MTDASRDAASLLRDFVNTLDVETGVDQIATPGRLDAWLDEHALTLAPSSRSDTASPEFANPPRATELELGLARRLREGLRAAMLGHHGPDEPSMPRDLDEAFAALPLRLAIDGGRPRLVPAVGGVRAGLARVAAAVMEAVADGTWARLKVCQESTCRWAFLDTSKNRSRAWCSMRVCGNRTKTRAYRARMRTTEEQSAEH